MGREEDNGEKGEAGGPAHTNVCSWVVDGFCVFMFYISIIYIVE